MPLCWVQHGTDLDVALTRLLTPVPQGGEAIHRNGIKVRDLAEHIVLLRFHGQDFFLDISHHVGPARETHKPRDYGAPGRLACLIVTGLSGEMS